MKIAIPLYDGFTALDAVGPYEVLSRLPRRLGHLAGPPPGPCAPTTACCASRQRRHTRTSRPRR